MTRPSRGTARRLRSIRLALLSLGALRPNTAPTSSAGELPLPPAAGAAATTRAPLDPAQALPSGAGAHCFPLREGPYRLCDTFGSPRGGGGRSHLGVDIV